MRARPRNKWVKYALMREVFVKTTPMFQNLHMVKLNLNKGEKNSRR